MVSWFVDHGTDGHGSILLSTRNEYHNLHTLKKQDTHIVILRYQVVCKGLNSCYIGSACI
jgi:hypothetical protein